MSRIHTGSTIPTTESYNSPVDIGQSDQDRLKKAQKNESKNAEHVGKSGRECPASQGMDYGGERGLEKSYIHDRLDGMEFILLSNECVPHPFAVLLQSDFRDPTNEPLKISFG